MQSEFQRKVFEIVSSIPKGEVRTYQWVAEKLGNSNAARAVGKALSKNPYPITIPCHRVIRKDGKLGGYIWGVSRKKAILEAEKAPVAQYGRAAAS